ncbi:ABC transporter related protein [Thermaerobacter marianensis DSM 12885]|uniref:ABC transporter related protein n=1 Tax=Thermaerobacter marianensis (strain ATCC 700841 / DSM 12885 / JCM 10246 / 7p75a) TaxID=644966 RepID=E6SH62_THEM7|nr:ABC transporter ATP-binding protein [Thermaerobacter marianensis]ADU51726.1 ABC transporter related protein [Thermaerobacter marianensis DSM 12885]
MDSTTAAVQLRGVGKRYGPCWAVRDLDMAVRSGEVYALLGRNGAGKTTTLRMILGLARRSTGEIELFGRRLEDWGAEVYRRVGATVETPGFYGNLTARENLLHNLMILGVPEPRRIDEVLELVGLRQAADRRVREFSLGMRQRLGIARALLHEPRLLILDEPTNGLDPAGIREVRELIRELAAERQMAVLLSSHILAEVEQVADRVGILHEGRLVEEVSMGELRDRGRAYVVIETREPEAAVRLLEERLAVRRYTVLPGGTLRVYEHVDRPEEVARVLIEHGLPVTHLAVQRESLEDHFLRATAGMGTNPDGRSGRAS